MLRARLSTLRARAIERRGAAMKRQHGKHDGPTPARHRAHSATRPPRRRVEPAIESGRAFDSAVTDEPRDETLEPLANYDLERMPRGV
jgi:hypothetical protein